MKTGIFISFGNDDKKLVMRLQKRLEKSEILYPIVITERRSSGQLNTDKVIKGLIECGAVLPLITKNSIYTQWINQEIGYAAALSRPFYPMVESGLLHKLKGFIHKERDLPYTFENSPNEKIAGKKFGKCYTALIEDLEKEFYYIILSKLNEGEKVSLKKGKIIGFQKTSRYLLLDNKVHLLTDGKAYKWIKQIVGSRDSMISKSDFDEYSPGRPMKV